MDENDEKIEEPDVSGLMPEIDHSHGHHHGTGIPWLDIIVGVSVIFISVLSLIVSIAHGRTMEKMVEQNQKLVAANTLPLLTFQSGNMDPETQKPRQRMFLTNGGVGPAIIDKFEMTYKGVNFHDPDKLMVACCGDTLNLHSSNAIYSSITGTILTPHETTEVLAVPLNEKNPKLFLAFEKARHDIKATACYCSVLDECWETHFDNKRPEPVANCKANSKEVLW